MKKIIFLALILVGMGLLPSCGKADDVKTGPLIGTWISMDDDAVYSFTQDTYAYGCNASYIMGGDYTYDDITKKLRLSGQGSWYEGDVKELTATSLVISSVGDEYSFKKVATPKLDGTWKLAGIMGNVTALQSIESVTFSGLQFTVKKNDGSSNTYAFLHYGEVPTHLGSYPMICCDGSPFRTGPTLYVSVTQLNTLTIYSSSFDTNRSFSK